MSEFYSEDRDTVTYAERNKDLNVVVDDSFCVFCGAPLSPGNLFCPSCGGRVQQNSETVPPPVRTKKRAPARQRQTEVGAEADPYAQGFMSAPMPEYQVQRPGKAPKNKWIYFILTLLLGMFGGHNFYENNGFKGALWYIPAIFMIAGVAGEIMNTDTDGFVMLFAATFMVNCIRYVVDLVKAIIRLVKNEGEEYTDY